jgi:hypothetical protein
MRRLLVPVWLSFCRCGLAFGLAWCEASGVGILFRQLDEDNDPGIRVDRKRSGSLQHVLSGRFQFNLSAGFFSSMLDGGLRSRALSWDALVRMIHHVQGQFSVSGDQFKVIGARGECLSAVEGCDRAGIFCLVGGNWHCPEEYCAQRDRAQQMFHDPVSQKVSFISLLQRLMLHVSASVNGGDGDAHHLLFSMDPPEVSRSGLALA